MTSELAQALDSEREVCITTYDQEGKPGTVPVWCVVDGGRVYITTMASSRKAQKLRVNPRVRLAAGSRRGPALEGIARFVSEREVFQRVASLLVEKYPGRGSPEGRVASWEQGDRVLLEVTPQG